MTTQPSHAPEDDIATLKARLPLPTLQYVDVAAQNELALALARWPLLGEMTLPASAGNTA